MSAAIKRVKKYHKRTDPKVLRRAKYRDIYKKNDKNDRIVKFQCKISSNEPTQVYLAMINKKNIGNSSYQ